jgi:DNA-binding CsgD family transcriptional regulator
MTSAIMERGVVENVGSGAPISPREDQVLRLRATGMTNIRAANILGLSEQTVKNHMASVYAKLGVDNLVAAMWVKGWVRMS